MVFAVNAHKRRAQEEAACLSYMSLAQADARSYKGTAETWPLWPGSARGIVLGIRKLIAFLIVRKLNGKILCVFQSTCAWVLRNPFLYV